MIIVVEGLHKEAVKNHVLKLGSSLTDCEVLCGRENWSYIDWVNAIQDCEKKNLVIVDSWLNFRAKSRLDEKEPHITNEETILLNSLISYKGGHIDFVTNKDEQTTMEQIIKDYGCKEEFAKKIFNEYTYEILQARIMCLTNAIEVL